MEFRHYLHLLLGSCELKKVDFDRISEFFFENLCVCVCVCVCEIRRKGGYSKTQDKVILL